MDQVDHLLHEDQPRGHGLSQQTRFRLFAAAVQVARRHVDAAVPGVQADVFQLLQHHLADRRGTAEGEGDVTGGCATTGDFDVVVLENRFHHFVNIQLALKKGEKHNDEGNRLQQSGIIRQNGRIRV